MLYNNPIEKGGTMQIQKFTLGALRSNCYVIHNDKIAYILDPGYDSQEVLDFIKEKQLDVQFIYITHGHPDHIGGIDYLNKVLNVPVYAPEKDRWWIDVYGPSKGITATITNWIQEPYEIPFNGESLQVYDTPGHSEGGTVIYSELDRYLFSGDTLFFETVGRTDIPYANKDILSTAIKRMYDIFPDDTKVYPGHGRETSIGHEKNNNPFIRKSAK